MQDRRRSEPSPATSAPPACPDVLLASRGTSPKLVKLIGLCDPAGRRLDSCLRLPFRLNVAFTPQSSGKPSATLSFASNAADSPTRIGLDRYGHPAFCEPLLDRELIPRRDGIQHLPESVSGWLLCQNQLKSGSRYHLYGSNRNPWNGLLLRHHRSGGALALP